MLPISSSGKMTTTADLAISRGLAPPLASHARNAIVRILPVLARNRSSEQVDAPSATGCVVGVPTKPRGSEIPLGVSAVGERLLRMCPEKGPGIEVSDSAIPVDEVPGSTLAKADEQQAIPIAAAVVGISLEEVLEVIGRNLGEPAKMMLLNRFPRPVDTAFDAICSRSVMHSFRLRMGLVSAVQKISQGQAAGIGSARRRWLPAT